MTPDAGEVRRQLDAGFAPRHLRLAQSAIARGHSFDGVIDPPIEEKVARAIADAERRGEAEAVVYLHADRCTVEPTTLTEDRTLRELLAEGEVALAMRPFPSTNDSPAVVLYGSPEQLRELAEQGIAPFVDDLVEDDE